MTTDIFEPIRKAIEILQSNPQLKKIEGSGWMVYMVGKIIRVDIKNE